MACGAPTNGSIAHPGAATKRASGGSGTMSTRPNNTAQKKRSLGTHGGTAVCRPRRRGERGMVIRASQCRPFLQEEDCCGPTSRKDNNGRRGVGGWKGCIGSGTLLLL